MSARPTVRGEIWLADLDKRRTAVIVSRDDRDGVRARATLAPVTTRIRTIPSHVALGKADGVAEACAINCDELLTVPKAQLVRHVATLSAGRLAELDRALMFALGLGPAS